MTVLRSMILCVGLSCSGCVALDSTDLLLSQFPGDNQATRTNPEGIDASRGDDQQLVEMVPGSRVRIHWQELGGTEHVTVGTVLAADQSGVALINSKTATRGRDHVSLGELFRKGGSLTKREFVVQQSPVQWLSQHDILSALITEKSPPGYVPHRLAINMDSESYFQRFDDRPELSQFEFPELPWN